MIRPIVVLEENFRSIAAWTRSNSRAYPRQMIFPMRPICVQNRDMILSKNTGCLLSLAAASLWMLSSAGALGQQSNANDSSPPSAANSQRQAGQKAQPSAPSGSGSGGNAFPIAQSEAAAKDAAQQNQREQTPPDNASTDPNTPSPRNGPASQNKPSPSKANPFPEAQSEAAAKADNGGSGTASHSQSGPSSSGYSSSNANLPPGALGQGSSNFHPKLDSFTRDQTQDGRVLDDLKVADFYMKNGNYRGALLRYHDALRQDPRNDTAVFGVAEATCKQNRTADAMALFKSYATNNPQGKYALKAEKMLAHPQRCMHNF